MTQLQLRRRRCESLTGRHEHVHHRPRKAGWTASQAKAESRSMDARKVGDLIPTLCRAFCILPAFYGFESLIAPWPPPEVPIGPVGCRIKRSLHVPPVALFPGATAASFSFIFRTCTAPCWSSEFCLLYTCAFPENTANLSSLSGLAIPDHSSERWHVFFFPHQSLLLCFRMSVGFRLRQKHLKSHDLQRVPSFFI